MPALADLIENDVIKLDQIDRNILNILQVEGRSSASNIADKISMDVSTVSRVANSKYVDTPYGTKLIKEFFSESMKNDQGEDVSTREIKKILEITISEENKRKPLTDDKLAKILLEKGYPIARRTIAKYREQLDLPVARLRKEI